MNKEKYELLKRMNSVNLSYLGSMVYDESDEKLPSSKVRNIHDVFVETIEDSNGNEIKKFFNENGKFLGATGLDGKIYPASEFSEQDLSFLGQLERLSNNRAISFDEYDKKLDDVSKHLGISKDKITSLSELELDQKINEKDEENEKISLDNDNSQTSEEQSKQNEEALEKMNSKQEINMDKLVDDKHSLADILGVQPGCKLVAVYSDAIADNPNSTRFSLIIKNPDGSLEPANMLEQTGGIDSDKTVYETNHDGSSVSQVNVKSSFKIKTPSDASKEGNYTDRILNVRYGSMGYIEVDYGEMDPTNHKYAFTQKLETDHDHYTTLEVREEFSNREGGERNITGNIQEIKVHQKNGCTNLTLAEADGDPNTGHQHEDSEKTNSNDPSIIIEKIKNGNSEISDTFSDSEILAKYYSVLEKNPHMSSEEAIVGSRLDLSDEAQHFPTHYRAYR